MQAKTEPFSKPAHTPTAAIGRTTLVGRVGVRPLLALILGLVLGLQLAPTVAAENGAIVVDSVLAVETGRCTLAEAVALAQSPEIETPCVWRGEAKVQLEAGRTYFLAEQLPPIRSNVHIDGGHVEAGAVITLDPAASPDRMLKVATGGYLELSRLILRGGQRQRGGAVRVGAGAVLQATTVTFDQNRAELQGGAIDNLGTTRLVSCVFTGNSAPFGGALHNGGDGTIDLSHSLLAGNGGHTTSLGGAIYQDGHELEISNSTLSANEAHWGGALYNKSGSTRFDQTTMRNNVARAGQGGALFAEWGDIELGRSALTAEPEQADLCFGSQYLSSAGNNAVSDDSCALDTPAVGPIAMSELVDHGGLSAVHTPLCDWVEGECVSPLIDQYPCSIGDRDQRNQFERGQLGGEHCDIGAYEAICSTGIASTGNFSILIHTSQISSQLGEVILNHGACASDVLGFGCQESGCTIRWLQYGLGAGIRNILFLEPICTYPNSEPIDCFTHPEDCRDHCLLNGTGLPPYPLQGGGPQTPDDSYTLQAPTCELESSVRYLIEFGDEKVLVWDPDLKPESHGGGATETANTPNI